MTSSTEERERERQRFEYLVLGRSRPRPIGGKASKRRKPPRPVKLAAGVDEYVELREAWSHKQGTPETHEHHRQAQLRPGALARLHASGAIDKDQLAAAEQIETAYRAITAGVTVRTASLEARVDGGGHGRAERQAIGRIHADLAYDFWRAQVGGCADVLLRIIVHDVPLTVIARDGRIGMPRARRMLTDALDLWWFARKRTMRTAAMLAGSPR